MISGGQPGRSMVQHMTHTGSCLSHSRHWVWEDRGREGALVITVIIKRQSMCHIRGMKGWLK